jgi:heme-degrading monooxygenase HmoA
MTHDQFTAQCDELAPAFAAIPGLIDKVWLSDATGNTYGGVYTWRDRAAFQAYAESALAKAVMTNPNFTDLTVRDFAVLEGPTGVTRGLPRAGSTG